VCPNCNTLVANGQPCQACNAPEPRLDNKCANCPSVADTTEQRRNHERSAGHSFRWRTTRAAPDAGSMAGPPWWLELRAFGWLPLLVHKQPDPIVEQWRGTAGPHIEGAVRMMDGLTLYATSSRELVARIEAVNDATRRGTLRPWWVAPGLTLDPSTKAVVWPEPVDSPTRPSEPLPEGNPSREVESLLWRAAAAMTEARVALQAAAEYGKREAPPPAEAPDTFDAVLMAGLAADAERIEAEVLTAATDHTTWRRHHAEDRARVEALGWSWIAYQPGKGFGAHAATKDGREVWTWGHTTAAVAGQVERHEVTRAGLVQPFEPDAGATVEEEPPPHSDDDAPVGAVACNRCGDTGVEDVDEGPGGSVVPTVCTCPAGVDVEEGRREPDGAEPRLPDDPSDDGCGGGR
jgi:hypothetical protein